MRFIKQRLLTVRVLALVLILLGAPATSYSQSLYGVTIDTVEGLIGRDSIVTGQLIKFHFRIFHYPQDSLDHVIELFHGLRVYSPDGAFWVQTQGQFTQAIDDSSLDVKNVLFASQTGSGADTVLFHASNTFEACGLASGFDDTAFTLCIGPLAPTNHGRSILIDSSFFAPFGSWYWILGLCDVQSGSSSPIWDGPFEYSIVDTTLTGTGSIGVGLPSVHQFHSPYPNPFNGTVSFSFTLSAPTNVSIDVYNVRGARIARAHSRSYPAGHVSTVWIAQNASGDPLSSGMYFARMKTDTQTLIRKLVHIK